MNTDFGQKTETVSQKYILLSDNYFFSNIGTKYTVAPILDVREAPCLC